MKDVHAALQQAHKAVWSLHQSSRELSDSDGHRNDAIRALERALQFLKGGNESAGERVVVIRRTR